MAGTIGTDEPGNAPSLELTDGRPHPLLNVASTCTLVVGLASFALGMVLRYVTSTHAHRDHGRDHRPDRPCWSASTPR